MTQRRVAQGEDFIWEEELNLEDCYANYLVACRILSEIYNWLLSDPQIHKLKWVKFDFGLHQQTAVAKPGQGLILEAIPRPPNCCHSRSKIFRHA